MVDHVNVASRLENLNKEYGTRVLIAENTMLAAKEDFNFKLVDEKNLRGKSRATRIYTLIDPATGEQVDC